MEASTAPDFTSIYPFKPFEQSLLFYAIANHRKETISKTLEVIDIA